MFMDSHPIRSGISTTSLFSDSNFSSRSWTQRLFFQVRWDTEVTCSVTYTSLVFFRAVLKQATKPNSHYLVKALATLKWIHQLGWLSCLFRFVGGWFLGLWTCKRLGVWMAGWKKGWLSRGPSGWTDEKNLKQSWLPAFWEKRKKKDPKCTRD